MTRFLLLAVMGVCTLEAPAQNGEAPAPGETWEVVVTVGQDGWMTYRNARFGGVIPVPPSLVPLRPPDNGDGQTFATPDGKTVLTMWGGFNVDDLGSLAARWKADLAEPGRTITYKRKTERWYVISGVRQDGTGFYERYTADRKYIAGWRLTYPQAEEKKHAAWIERIAKGYDARLGKGADTME